MVKIKDKILSNKLFFSSSKIKLNKFNRFFRDLVTKTTITDKQLREMLNGATIVIYNDNYAFLKKIKQSCGYKIGKQSKKLSRKLKTSHNDLKGQYRCNKSKVRINYL